MIPDLFVSAKPPRSGYICAIDAGFAYAGLVVTEGEVVQAAPIFRYMVGWKFPRVAKYVRTRGWKIRHADRPPAPKRMTP